MITTAAHEAPVLMRPELVRETLQDRKTQTRRIVDLDRLKVRLRREVRSDLPAILAPPIVAPAGVYRAMLNQHGAVRIDVDGRILGVKPGEFDFLCPYAVGRTHLGDYGDGRKHWTIEPEGSRLWVRETWAYFGGDEDLYLEDRGRLHFRADQLDGCAPTRGSRWRPSIFMPRWACRLELDVLSVRLEHLQEISLGDCVAEGCPREEWYMVAGGARKWFSTNLGQDQRDARGLGEQSMGVGDQLPEGTAVRTFGSGMARETRPDTRSPVGGARPYALNGRQNYKAATNQPAVTVPQWPQSRAFRIASQARLAPGDAPAARCRIVIASGPSLHRVSVGDGPPISAGNSAAPRGSRARRSLPGRNLPGSQPGRIRSGDPSRSLGRGSWRLTTLRRGGPCRDCAAAPTPAPLARRRAAAGGAS